MAKIANSCVGTKPADQAVVEKEPKKNKSVLRFAIPAFAVAMVALLVGLGAPVSAEVSLNLTWIGTMFASLIEAVNTCAVPFETFMETWFPILIELIVYGVIFGVIAVVGYAFRGIIMADVRMLEGILQGVGRK